MPSESGNGQTATGRSELTLSYLQSTVFATEIVKGSVVKWLHSPTVECFESEDL